MADVKNFAVNPEPELVAQIEQFANSKAYRDCKIRIMADGHSGRGCAIGSVVQYADKIVPATVGVDICCRVSAFWLGDCTKSMNYERLDKIIHERIPAGHAIRVKPHGNDTLFPYKELRCWGAINDKADRIHRSIGTLGGGKVGDCLQAA